MPIPPAMKIAAGARSSSANALSGSDARTRSPARASSTKLTDAPRPVVSRLTAIS